ncbi:MAG TPA: hypothetical protein VFO41_02490 [Alphaproteobacteria bacterium]|nr:hypothetical protein [Alphaproteobacteria bacterium]
MTTKDTEETTVGLFANRAPTAKFQQIGDSCAGTIVDIGKAQRTEFKRDGSIGDPMFWSGGRPVAGAEIDPRSGEPNQPVMDHVITVDTGVADENGDTERRIFVKGKADLAAIKEACIAAGVRDIEVGGRIQKIWKSGEGGTADPRVYVYRYQPPGVQGGLKPISEIAPEVLDRIERVHANSPVLNRPGNQSNAGFEESVPF